MTNRSDPPPFFDPIGVNMQISLSHVERDDNYANVIMEFRQSWRLIICKDFRQYILQHRSARKPNHGVWVGKSHTITKAGLILSGSRLKLLTSIEIVERLIALPDFARDYRKI